MKIIGMGLMAAVLACGATAAFAAVKPCDELKGEIEGKLKEKGVTNYTLEVVPADQIKDQKVIGSCDGGKSKITYSKGAAEAPAAPEKLKEKK
jgi:hypothetical protein